MYLNKVCHGGRLKKGYLTRKVVKITRVVLPGIVFLLIHFALQPQDLSAASESDSKPPKFILIHLDSASSQAVKEEMDAGNLPNLQSTFTDGYIEKAVTYFPAKTPTVISSLRNGDWPMDSELPGWSYQVSDLDDALNMSKTFLRMMFSKQRIAYANLLHGLPIFDRLAGQALANVPELLEQYRYVEFYWYPVDTYGHFFGEEDYRRKLTVFDKHFGRMMERLDKEEVNIIIYADHGMKFGEGVKLHYLVKWALGDQVLDVSYPNLYLKDPANKEEVARELLYELDLHFTFFSVDSSTVQGYHKKGTVWFIREDGGIRYEYEGEDPFGYYEEGYNGEVLSKMDWVHLTYQSDYPATPINILNLMSNPRAGDVLTLLGKNQYNKTSYSRSGNHGGILAQDTSVPLMLKGPELEFLYNRETYWLPNLFNDITSVDFTYRPSRDDHYLNAFYDFNRNRHLLRLSLSPRYRWRIGGEMLYHEFHFPEELQGWVKYDLFRSHLSRIWVGGGVHSDQLNNELRPMGFIQHEFRLRRLTARSTLNTTGDHRFALELRISPVTSLQVVNFNSAGLRIEF